MNREKSQNNCEARVEKNGKSIDCVGVAIEKSTKTNLVASSVSLQFKIIQCMSLPEARKGERLMKLLERASSLDPSDGQLDESQTDDSKICRGGPSSI